MSKHWLDWHVSQLTDEECVKLLMPQTAKERLSFWLFTHCRLLWQFIYWNWFNVFTGEEGFWLFARHGFRTWERK